MSLFRRVLNVQKPDDVEGAILEAWAQGFMVGALLIMAAVTLSNMRRGVLLHKLILLELICGMFHGTFIFTSPPVYNWYLSTTAIFLNFSWSLHNVIAWMKNKPFLSKWASRFYIWTVILVQPYWVIEIAANFLYFSNTNALFVSTRPYEALFRDPWWIYTCLSLLWNVKTRYDFEYIELVRVSPRFGVLIASMLLSMIFIVVDILAVTHVIGGRGLPDGINPFWKLAFVFKCLTDTIILDDFKTALDRLKDYKLQSRSPAFLDLNNDRDYPVDLRDLEHVRYKADGDVEALHISHYDGHGARSARETSDEGNTIDLLDALRMDRVERRTS